MTIGERIKVLRKKNDLTQEKLADYLCVSYQAVSKWECGASSHDLSLIGPLTRLLHVSADELHGLTSENTDDRRRELEAKYQQTWETGDLSIRYDTACAAVSEYPGEMKTLIGLLGVKQCVPLVSRTTRNISLNKKRQSNILPV